MTWTDLLKLVLASLILWALCFGAWHTVAELIR